MTVLIAAWNEEGAIAQTVAQFADSSYPGPLEIVLADNNSTDQTDKGRGGGASASACGSAGIRAEPGKHRALKPRSRPSPPRWS